MGRSMHPTREKPFVVKPCTNSLPLELPSTIPTIQQGPSIARKRYIRSNSAALYLLRSCGSPSWHENLAAYLALRQTLADRYANDREQNRVPVEIAAGKSITLSPGTHSELILCYY